MGKRLPGIDFIRCISALIIICFHLNCALVGIGMQPSFLYMHNNGEWGETAVTLFFLISGLGLYRSYNEQINIKQFYIKRWMSIFPMFYLVWGICAVYRYLMTGNLCWSGLGNYWGSSSKRYYLLSLLGIDGYFMYLHDNFYIVGEWFLGAIILIYVLYPLIRLLYNKIPIISTCVLLLLFVGNIYTSFFEISHMRNLITCITSFWIGMIIEKHKLYSYKWVWIICVFLSSVMILISVPLPKPLGSLMLGYFLFFPLFALGGLLGKIKGIESIISSFGKSTYAVFLVHHVIINVIINVMPVSKFNVMQNVLFKIYILVVILMVSFGITNIVNCISSKLKVR